MRDKAQATVGAQWSASTELWIGWLYDGNIVTRFEGRSTRDRALEDAWNHHRRLFDEQVAERRWTREL